ncbi:hypothetical protein PROFUN_05755 [Planoprotostelium fungivorum]|uniref:FAD synthase middle domain-containing protein n=1 Tax=Planoprotostelium fungivorum TaxID=1890364 RepID=A0A2P6NPV3_9EUKA|nr:hypothetical protein PROFUN_05755 [Planoprotostelium fungivorum]
MNKPKKQFLGCVAKHTPPEDKKVQDKTEQVSHDLFVRDNLWVPVVRLSGKLCVLPGVPSIFEQLLQGLTPYLPLPPSSSRQKRVIVFTKMLESNLAPFLTSLQEKVKSKKIKIGSYPEMGVGVNISLIGTDEEILLEAAEQVVKELEGKIVSKGDV